MNNQQQISAGQLIALLLTSRLAVSLTFAPTIHQQSNGTDFLISLLLQGVLLAALLLPTWWFSRRSKGIGTVDYSLAVLGKGGRAVAVAYGFACLAVQFADLLRFSRFAASTLSPDMSSAILIVVLMLTAGIAAFYGIQAVARSAVILAFFVVLAIVLASLFLLPQMELINFPPLFYDGFSPVIAGALEELPRSLETAVLGLLLPYVRGSAAKGYLAWCGIFTAVALIIQATVAGVLGDFGALEQYPYYTALTTVRIGVIQRLDIVAIAIWIGALFLKTAFFGMLFIDCFQRVIGEKWRLIIAAAGEAAVVAGALLLGGRLPVEAEQSAVWVGSAVIMGLFAVALPLALAILDLVREKRRSGKLGTPEKGVAPS